MELTPLRYFRALAAAGHMTRAARELGVSQPALSAMLKKLEGEVGARLVERTGRGVELTDAGRLLLDHAELALRAVDAGQRAVRELMGLERGTVRVGGGATGITYLLPPVIKRLRTQHPGLRFYLREAGSEQVAMAVTSGDLDLGIVTLPLPGRGEESLRVVPLVDDELRLIVPPGHRLAEKRGFEWADVAGEPFVGFEAGSAVRDLIDNAARPQTALNYVMELRSIEGIKRMVAVGIGLGFVSRFALGPDQGLRLRGGPLARRLAIVRRGDRGPSPALAALEAALLSAHARARASRRSRVLGRGP